MAYSRLKCPKCESDFGQESRFLDHLTDFHNIQNHRELYVEMYHEGTHPTCACSVSCSVTLPWMGWKKGFTSKFARGHNARIDSVYLDKDRQKQFAAKRKDGLATGRLTAWGTGETKKTNAKIAAAALKISSTLRLGYASGSIINWRVDQEKAARASAKLSATMKAKSAAGTLNVWNKDETKETNAIVALIAQKISARYASPDAGKRIKQVDLQHRIDLHAKNFELISSLDDYEKRRVSRLVFRCKTCGSEQQKSLAMLEESPACFVCHPKSSIGECEVLDFVKSLGIDVISCDRSTIAPKELDIYIPSHKFAIEYNGLFWHSVARHPDPVKHQQAKLRACQNADVRLFSIYEDEWRDHRSLIETMIKHRLGLTTERFGARSLKIIQLKPSLAKTFFDNNHLEGYVRSRISFGLFDQKTNRVVAAMSLRTAFHKKYATFYEVGRSCTLPDVAISGWLGRLTSAALVWAKSQGKQGLMTYVDSRVGIGSGYSSAGWTLVNNDTKPRFWWTDFVNRYNRFKVKANARLGITQAQAALDAGVVAIYGCSNSLWQIT